MKPELRSHSQPTSDCPLRHAAVPLTHSEPRPSSWRSACAKPNGLLTLSCMSLREDLKAAWPAESRHQGATRLAGRQIGTEIGIEIGTPIGAGRRRLGRPVRRSRTVVGPMDGVAVGPTSTSRPGPTRSGENAGTGELLPESARRAVHEVDQRSACGRAGSGRSGGRVD
jgi:hypothetical protein